jgi:hypothetical protein
MTGPQPQQPTFYRPAEVARMLRCSEWWVKEQARKRRIPYCWIGGSYLFTPQHIGEIVRLFEVRPTDEATHASPVRGTPDRRFADDGGEPVLLRARTPRRARDAANSKPFAA